MPSFDDWFWWERLDDATFAIREPEYWQRNTNFLICGNDRAILFDSGPGKRDIRPVVEHLTRLPVTVTCSHTHWDHIGNHHRFDSVAMPDLPIHRRQVKRGVYRTSLRLSLAVPPRRFRITEWWKPGEYVELGDRRLRLLHVPGHTPDSVALHDPERGLLFIGDVIYTGQLVACTPGADLAAYQRSVRYVLDACAGATTICCAHGAPRIDFAALAQLDAAFDAIAAGRAPYTQGRFLVWPTRQYFFPGFSLITKAK